RRCRRTARRNGIAPRETMIVAHVGRQSPTYALTKPPRHFFSSRHRTMPVAKLTCPKCKSILRPAKPLPSGKTVKCPKCGTVFKAVEEQIQDAIPFLPEEPPAQPASAKKHYTEDEEDDGPATYRFADEPERKIERDD